MSLGAAAFSHLFPLGDGSASSQLSHHAGHVRTVSRRAKTSKEAAACVPRSFGVLCVGFDTPGTAGFLKAAVHNRHPRVGTGAPRLCLFYFVEHHYLTERQRLELRSTCIDERPLRFPRTQSAVRPAQHKHHISSPCPPSRFPLDSFSQLVASLLLETLHTSYESGRPAITLRSSNRG